MCDKRYVSTSEFAKEFSVSQKTVIDWLQSGRIKGIQPYGPGGNYKILASEVDRIKSESAERLGGDNADQD